MGYISVFSFLNYSTEEMMLSRKAKGEGSVIFGNDGSFTADFKVEAIPHNDCCAVAPPDFL